MRAATSPAPRVAPAPVVQALGHAAADPDAPAILDGATGQQGHAG
jgi:hypothetical protein